MSDHDIQVLESQFPALSGQAFAAASAQVLASGQSVLQSEGASIYRVFPDGRKEVVKHIEPPDPRETRHGLHDQVSLATPRLRMFAGPNGSGKSVLKSYLPEPLLGVYLNPDDIEKAVRDSGYVDMHSFGIETTAAEVVFLIPR
jgi:hypothetical protein